MKFDLDSEHLLKIMLEIQQNVDAATGLSTEDVMNELVKRLREFQVVS